MKLLAPKYYKDFTCIADRCRHSCCIGWEIDVDDEARKKYNEISHPYGEIIRESICYEGTPHFALCEGDRCPHLDERGLCKIITNLGEDCLCHICREHPRFYNETPGGLEAGLGISCEEACRIVLSSDDYREQIVIGETEGDPPKDFDSLPLRQKIYDILSDRSVPYPERLERIYDSFEVCPASLSDEDWRELLSSLEYLCDSHREQFFCYSSDTATPEALFEPLERALAYFVYRHTGSVTDENDFRSSLGFALFCERLLASVVKGGTDIFEAARIISEELEYSEENTEAIKFEFWF